MMMQFAGTVIDGKKRGRQFGVATANLDIAGQPNIETGVYLVDVGLEGGWHPALLHFGARSTFEGDFTAEVHVLDFEGDLYGRELTVKVGKKLRETQKFETPAGLFDQIQTDITQARKFFIRREIKNRWDELPEKARKSYAQLAYDQVAKMPEFESAKVIYAYAPDQYEIGFVEKLCKTHSDKNWYFPSVKNGKMQFYRVEHYSELRPGYLGLLEPKPGLEEEPPNLILVPAVAATMDGTRLGRGGGFYDRFLNTPLAKGITVCVLPDFAVLEDVPVEGHDQKIDKIIKIA